MPSPEAGPELSVIIPCLGRVPALERLLASFAAQTLERRRYEVVLVDDGNQPPLAETLRGDAGDWIRLLRQPNQGPAEAKNTGIRLARGRVLLFLNADAVLAPTTLERHLAWHPEDATPVAVIGRFDATPSCRSTVVEICERRGIVFPYHLMTPGEPSSGRFFWTSNLSVPAAVVRRAGGFDPRFRRPIWEDVELGVRLEQQGVRVYFDSQIACGHDHPMNLAGFLRRAWQMGHEWVRFAAKHGPAAVPVFGAPHPVDTTLAHRLLNGLLAGAEAIDRAAVGLQAQVRELDGFLETDRARFTSELERRLGTLAFTLEQMNVNEPARGTMDAIFGFSPEDTARTRRGEDGLVWVPGDPEPPPEVRVALTRYAAVSPVIGAVGLGAARGSEAGAEVTRDLPPGHLAVRSECWQPGLAGAALAEAVRSRGRLLVTAWLGGT